MLVGGSSTRMGSDKAQLQVDGETLVDRVLHQMSLAGLQRLVVVGGSAPATSRRGVSWIPDSHPGAGPVCACWDALMWGRQHGVHSMVVLACDLPALRADDVVQLCGGDLSELRVASVHGRLAWPNGRWPVSSLELLPDAQSLVGCSFTEILRRLPQVVAVECPSMIDADSPQALEEILAGRSGAPERPVSENLTRTENALGAPSD